MPPMVVFRTTEGKPGYHLAETLDDAVRFVEHLRNNEQVAESKVYRMHEVPIEFKVMYKVEVAGAGSTGGEDQQGAAEAFRAAETAAAPPPPAGANTATAQDRSATSAQDRSEPARAAEPASSPTGSAPSPVPQSGGRFGLFSRT